MIRAFRRHFRSAAIIVACLTLFAASFSESGFFEAFFGKPKQAFSATCPWSDGDGTDSDGAANGTYTFTTSPGPTHNVPSSVTAYDCTSAATGITTFTVPSGVTLVMQGGTATAGTGYIAQVNFTNLTVNSGGTVSADSQGCTGAVASHGDGPNTTTNVCTDNGTGAGDKVTFGAPGSAAHGGAPGQTGTGPGVVYGSATAPVLFGSSGGGSNNLAGGAGGGVIRLDIAGTLTHNGTMTADGAQGTGGWGSDNQGSGSGSGGSIYVTAGTVNGTTGVFGATGAAGNNTNWAKTSGAGGGRIAVQYGGGTFSFDSADFNVSGGAAATGTQPGEKGTVYVNNTAASSITIYHGFTWTDTDFSVTTFTSDASATNQYCDLSIATSATPSVTASGTLTFGGSFDCEKQIASFNLSAGTAFSFTSGALIDIDPGDIDEWAEDAAPDLTAGGSMDLNLPAASVQTWTSVTIDLPYEKDLTIDDAVSITLDGTTNIKANVRWTNLNALTINGSAGINATSKGCRMVTATDGYGPTDASTNTCILNGLGAGQGANAVAFGGGGSHGGAGGDGMTGSYPGGDPYDDPVAPILYGASGGGASSTEYGGAGGGIVRINVNGTFTHNGGITADGGAGSADNSSNYAGGGGGGGAIYVTADTIAGAGMFSADGGGGGVGFGDGPGGGGGRVAVVYDSSSYSFDSTDFSMAGGAGSGGQPNGDKGTVYVKDTTNNNVSVFHGFTYGDVDYAVANWTSDTSATNQHCATGIASGASPSIATTGNLTFGGTLNCPTNLVSFGFSAGGTLDLSASASITVQAALNISGTGGFTVGSGVSLAQNRVNYDLDMTIPNGSNLNWSGMIVTVAREGAFLMNDVIALTLSSGAVITANVEWPNLTTFTMNSGTSINANSKGCIGGTANDGYGPQDASTNTCILNGLGAGQGANSFGTAGGAGHGGAGGAGGQAAGAAYDSTTAPILFGAGGGGMTNSTTGGTGGGLVSVVASGTMTVNGTISADGGQAGVGTGGTNHGGGGGGGGTIYLASATIAGSTGVLSADGGLGPSVYPGGPGGGGGRIRVQFEANTTSGSFTLDDVADTINGTGNTVHTAAGTAPYGGNAGSAGTLSIQNLNPPPVATANAPSPANPFTDDFVTISGSATDSGGVTEIKLYLGIVDPANLKRTCTFSPATSPANCSHGIGQLARGGYTLNVVASDGSQTDTDSLNFNVAGYTTGNQMTVSRNAAGSAGVDFDLSFTLGGSSTGNLTVTFPAGFTVTQAFTSGSCSGGGTVDTFGFAAQTLTAVKTGCTGTVSVLNAQITLPGTPGEYIVSWTNDNGTAIIAVVDDDQVSVSGAVDPVITFVIGVQAAATACDGTFAGSGGTLGLGALTTGSVASSDAASIPHICSRVSHNGTGGAVVSVRSLFGEMRSTSTPADAIASGDATPLAAGTEGYGLCVGSGGSDTGVDVTVPAGSSPARTAPFNGTCTSTDHNIGGFTGATQTIWTLAGPAQNAFARIYLKAGISPITEAHDDYTDSLTFIATATY